MGRLVSRLRETLLVTRPPIVLEPNNGSSFDKEVKSSDNFVTHIRVQTQEENMEAVLTKRSRGVRSLSDLVLSRSI